MMNWHYRTTAATQSHFDELAGLTSPVDVVTLLSTIPWAPLCPMSSTCPRRPSRALLYDTRAYRQSGQKRRVFAPDRVRQHQVQKRPSYFQIRVERVCRADQFWPLLSCFHGLRTHNPRGLLIYLYHAASGEHQGEYRHGDN